MALSRLKKKYVEEIVPDLMQRLQYKSVMQVPKIKKISINQGLGAAVNDKKLVQAGVDELTLITGQKAVATKAKKSISNFISKHKIDYFIHAAAFSTPMALHKIEAKRSIETNIIGSANVALSCLKKNIKLIYK